MVKTFTEKAVGEDEEQFELHYDLLNNVPPESVAIVSAWVAGQVLCLSIPVKWEDNLDTNVRMPISGLFLPDQDP